jgi:hypothetical protein
MAFGVVTRIYCSSEVATTKFYLIRRLYDLRMKEFDLITAHENEYISQLLAQGMTINDELKALLLMSSLPPSWETLVMTICNASTMAMKHSEMTSSIFMENARRKMFVQNMASEAYSIQSTGDAISWKKFLTQAKYVAQPE